MTFVFTDWQDGKAVAAAKAAKPGQCLLIENTRFHPGEEKNDTELAKVFASLGDTYVNDAFSAAHRAHSSTEGVARLVPAHAGRAMEAELKALEAALENPKRPLVAVVGGAKVSTKLELLGNLSGLADVIVIGGGMANTFLAALGYPVGKSLCEHDLAQTREGHRRHGKVKVLRNSASRRCRGCQGVQGRQPPPRRGRRRRESR